MLDFIFKSGKFITEASTSEPFWLKISPQVIGAILSALVAVWIFHLGQKKTNTKEKNKENKRLANIRLLFYISALRLNDGISLQILEFIKRSDQIKLNQKNNIADLSHPDFAITSSPKNLLEIDRNDIFKSFVQQSEDDVNIRIRLYSDLYHSLETVSSIILQMKDAENEKTTRYSERKIIIEDKSSKLLQKLMSASQWAAQNNPSKVIEDPFYIALAKIYEKYKEGKEDFTIDHRIREFMHPCLNVALKPQYIGHQDSISIVNICEEAQALYNLILEDLNEQLNQILHWQEHYTNAAIILSRIIEIEAINFNFGREVFDLQPSMDLPETEKSEKKV